MCWTNNFKIAACIANMDIPIFKICYYINNMSISSYYTRFYYELNKVYKLEKALLLCYNEYTNQYDIHTGFHSYDNNCSTIKNYSIIEVISPPNCILDRYEPWCVKAYGYIPKGSRYYLNNKGEYVSDIICLTAIENL